MLFYMMAIIVILVDQLSKIWIRNHMVVGENLSFLDPYVHFEYYLNSGAAFSSFQGYGKLFVIFAVFVVCFIIYYKVKGYLSGAVMDIGAALLAGGAVGNAIDRLVYGKVTDFIVIGSGSGIMNLADIAINIGLLLIIIRMLFRRRKPKY